MSTLRSLHSEKEETEPDRSTHYACTPSSTINSLSLASRPEVSTVCALTIVERDLQSIGLDRRIDTRWVLYVRRMNAHDVRMSMRSVLVTG